MTQTLEKSEKIGLELIARGKVRDIYQVGEDKLLLIATDRISAFDCVLSPPIPEKGKLLTQLSAYWFDKTKHLIPNHLISADLAEIKKALPTNVQLDDEAYDGRVMLVRKAKRVDAECVARGYIVGSGWKEYGKTGKVCGHTLPEGLQLAQKLDTPIFTPATKADTGHDENISRETLSELVGAELAKELEEITLKLYAEGSKFMAKQGLILADTKFEFGFIDGKLSIIDEMLTPDSSRFWEESKYKLGTSPESFDKQFVRDYLETQDWDKRPPAPVLPENVVSGTTARYREAYERLTK
jgi:phosphoribosylaminoimidazole-succinocarboxamide synthase